MLWIKALHIFFVVSWFAGLFYLPRLFVYHAMTGDAPGRERFKIMERKLYGESCGPGRDPHGRLRRWLMSYGAWGRALREASSSWP
jgi:putative membrane protein